MKKPTKRKCVTVWVRLWWEGEDAWGGMFTAYASKPGPPVWPLDDYTQTILRVRLTRAEARRRGLA